MSNVHSLIPAIGSLVGGGMALVIIPPLLLGFHFRARLGKAGRIIWGLATGGAILALVVIALGRIWNNYCQPPEFDFQLYWLFGRVAQLGQNPYDAENLRRLAAEIPASEVLLGEAFFLHSPPTLFLFAPLGWFDMRTSCLLWQVFHAVMLVLAVVCLWRQFQQPERWLWLLAVALLALSLRSTMLTFRCTQVNFLSLALFMGFWRYRAGPLGGVFLGLALVVKPVFFLVPLYLLARKQWSALGGLALTALAACAASIVAFGLETFCDYFTASPISRGLPDYLYTELMNQSLLATALRVTQYDLDLHSPYANPLFWTLAVPITAATAWLIWRLPDKADEWALSLSLVLSLLLFPKTLLHYGVLLLPAILLLYSQRDKLPGGVWAVASVLTVCYVAAGANQVFLGIVVVWVALVAYGMVLLARERGEAAIDANDYRSPVQVEI